MDTGFILLFSIVYLTIGWCWLCILVRIGGIASCSRFFCWFSFLFWPLSIIATVEDVEENDEKSAQKHDGEGI
ncbi:hypothetical protein ACVGV8_15785 [Enterobacter intestinihominis]|nr:Uncharacterised protein [Enterobacter hormaechei]